MRPEELARLDREAYLNLATFRRSGAAVETPVWFAAHAGRLYVFTEADAGKVKRLRANAVDPGRAVQRARSSEGSLAPRPRAPGR